MPYPLTIFGNPRRSRRNAPPRDERRGSPVATYRGVTIWYKLGHYFVEMTSAQGSPVRHGRLNTERAARQFIGFALKRGARPADVRPMRRNPETLPTLVAIQQSERVYEIKYKHVVDGDDYVHKFRAGVCMELLADGSVRLYRNDGRPLFRNFPDD